jgi:hypothetical protein
MAISSAAVALEVASLIALQACAVWPPIVVGVMGRVHHRDASRIHFHCDCCIPY